MAHQRVTTTKDIPRFEGNYSNVWKHRLTMLLKAKKLWSLVKVPDTNPLQLTSSSAQQLPTIGACSISYWEDKDAHCLTIINNYLENK